ncbi:TetR family transcriptional regulator [Streptomyces sparsogenes DSM 40356]|uniref:TetR family transcriptional regulator n=1 Tax=Streptomyces sparsogenes DSM 40356 TaxID=1331668 RepID=A0A1R1SCL3_9ACTN|nr:TetR family transcriptional regulator [Streptomyces sparsogenes DSM 40356]
MTVARTAAEAGMSVGLVQHYFTAKDEMLLATFTRVNERFTSRVDELVHRGEAEGCTIAEMLRQALTELMPLDDARRAELLVRRAFADTAAHNACLAAVQRETLVGIRSRVAQAIRNGTVCGEVGQGVDAAGQALQIVAFAEGLALHTHIDPDGTPDRAVLAALDDHLSRVFTGTCRHAQLG